MRDRLLPLCRPLQGLMVDLPGAQCGHRNMNITGNQPRPEEGKTRPQTDSRPQSSNGHALDGVLWPLRGPPTTEASMGKHPPHVRKHRLADMAVKPPPQAGYN